MRKEALPLYLFSFFMIMPLHGLFPLLPLIRDDLNASYSQISFFLACMGIVRLSLAYPSGYLADRFDQTKILLLSGGFGVCGLLIMSVSQNFFQLLVSRVLIGSSSILCNITILAILARMAGPKSKGTMMSMNNVVHSAGGIVTPALSGLVAKWYHWRVSFAIIAVLILISMAMTWAMLKNRIPARQRGSDSKAAPPAPEPEKKIRQWVVQLMPVFAFGFFVFFYRGYFRHTILPFYGKDVFRMDVDELGFYFSLTAGVAMVSLTVFGYLSDRIGRRAVLIPGIFISALAAAALLLPDAFNPFFVSCFLLGVGAIINSMPNVLISDWAPPRSFGRVMGINRVFADTGYFLGTLASGVLLDYLGFRIPVYGIAAYALAMVLLMHLCVPGRPDSRRASGPSAG